MSGLWILAHLLWLSVEDLRETQISLLPVAALGAEGFIRAVWLGEPVLWQPGAALLCVGWLSGERIGMGDGWLMLALGMWLPMEELLGMLAFGLAAGAVFGAAAGKREVPLVPFLTAGFVFVKGGVSG
ncbi:MAG: hypothetical protein Q4C82_09175 [Eubacteriales bacterium]|nr:hypothetical protein [Eubacteriales bacterium]